MIILDYEHVHHCHVSLCGFGLSCVLSSFCILHCLVIGFNKDSMLPQLMMSSKLNLPIMGYQMKLSQMVHIINSKYFPKTTISLIQLVTPD